MQTRKRVQDLWANRAALWQHNKRRRVQKLQDTLYEVITNIAKGETYDADRMRESDFFQYLRTYYAAWRREPMSKQADEEVRIRMQDSINLFHNIKANGIKDPLEMYKHAGKRYLILGNRRLVIAYVLGIPEVDVITHDSFEQYAAARSKVPDAHKGRGA